MHKVILVFLFTLFTLFSADLLLITNQANAVTCCMCTGCSGWCTCRGTHPACPKCAFPNDVSVRHVSQPLSLFASETPGADRLRKLAIESQCPQNKPRFPLIEENYQLTEQAFVVTTLHSEEQER